MLLVGAIILMIWVLPPAAGIALVVLALAAEVLELALWRRMLSRYRVVTGAEGLVGEEGIVAEPCEPHGTVRLRGEIWKATAETPLGRGERIRVVRVDGLTLRIAPRMTP